MKKFASVLCAVFLITFVGVNSASAEPVNLDNGYINSNISYSFLHSEVDDWGNVLGESVYLYKDAFDGNSKIALTNASGLGVTLISGGKCFTTDIYDRCGNNHSSDATINSTTTDVSEVKSFSSGADTFYYGTVVFSQEVSVGGNTYLVRNTINLNQDESFLTIVTQVQNLSNTATSVNLYINNYDGMIFADVSYRMTRGNLVDGVFTGLSLDTEYSNAVVADADTVDYGSIGNNHRGAGYGAILYTNETDTTSHLYQGCCSPAALAGLDSPNGGYVAGTDLTLRNVDGSYSIGKSVSISSGQTYAIKWGFGGGPYSTALDPSLLFDIQDGVSQASAAELKSKAKPVSNVRQSSNLSFSQSMYGSDTLSDPDGQLRALLDYIIRVFGS